MAEISSTNGIKGPRWHYIQYLYYIICNNMDYVINLYDARAAVTPSYIIIIIIIITIRFTSINYG